MLDADAATAVAEQVLAALTDEDADKDDDSMASMASPVIDRGMAIGDAAKPLFALDWPSLLHRDLEELRQVAKSLLHAWQLQASFSEDYAAQLMGLQRSGF